MSPKIIFIDDESKILSAFKRQLRKQYDIETAESGEEGLKLIRQKGPFEVVITDMNMPGMNGIDFLKEAKKIAPDMVRVMLTGNADQQTAIDAVNDGQVFRFITKPCSLSVLTSIIDASIQQAQLQKAEKELLEGTLDGVIAMLMDVMSLIAPAAVSSMLPMKMTAIEMARTLHVEDEWEIGVAVMLAHVAYITLPPATITKMQYKKPLSPREEDALMRLPEVGHKLLALIPRLGNVANIVLYQNKNYDGTGFPRNAVRGEDLPMGSRILKLLIDMVQLQEDYGYSAHHALEELHKKSYLYDPKVLRTAEWFFADDGISLKMSKPIDVSVGSLKSGQLLVSNVETQSGKLVVSAGQILSDMLIEKIRSQHYMEKMKEPIQVSVNIE